MHKRAWLIFVWSAACQHQPAMREDPVITDPDKLAATGAIATTAPAPATGNVLHRADVVAMLDKTPGYFLQKVVYEPAVKDGHFVGWRIDEPVGPLRAGDVVQTINGRALERPEQVYDVWQALKSSNELVIQTQRGLQSRTLRWQIVDDVVPDAR